MNGRLAAGGAAIGLVLLLTVAGCSSDSGSDKNASSAGVSAPQGAADRAVAGDAGVVDKAPGPAQQAAPAKYETDPRAIVYNGSMSVRVDRPDAVAGRVGAIATGAGGFVGSDKRSSDNDRSQATITLRVPAAKFGGVVDEVARLGTELSREISTEDVTDQVVDLDARLASQRASVNRTRALLAQAKTVGEIVSIESELAKRESDLGVLEARKRSLDNLTTLSTITVTLLGPDAEAAPPGSKTGFVAGVKAGWKAFVGSMRVLLTVLGALLPWLVILGVPAFAAIWIARRRMRRAPTPAPAAASPDQRPV